MAGSQEIRTQIKSIQNTQKITKAMEMVAASKMRKAVNQMEMARPYADKISEVMPHLANAHPEYDSAFFDVRTIKKRAYIVISSDRGLCGGLNNNLFKSIIAPLDDVIKPLKDILGFVGKIAKVVGKIFIPIGFLFSAFDVISNIVDGYKEGGITGAIGAGIESIFDDVLFAFPNLLGEAVAWGL